MNRQGSIDGVLEAWFLDGPNEMPDRVFEAVFDRVERAPQRPLSRLLLRFSDMSAPARLAAAGVATVLVVGVGFAVFGRSSETAPAATPPPSTTPDVSPTAGLAIGPIPAQLHHVFLGPQRDVPGVPAGDRTMLDFTNGGFLFWSGSQVFLSSSTGADAETLLLVARSGPGGCAKGDVGRYRWSATPGGSLVTLEAVSDECAARLAAIPGTWQRSACLNRGAYCLGEIEAGTYSSQNVRPDLPEGAATPPEFGAIRYAVPAGWANSEDASNLYSFMHGDDYAAGGVNVGANPPDAVSLLVNPFAARLHAGCPAEREAGIGADRANLGAWLLAHPGLDVTQQADISIDGREASVFDLALADGWTETCPENPPFVAAPIFYNGYHFALGKDDLMRVILLDVGPGATAAITIEVQDISTYDQLIAEAMPIVESFDFK